MTPDRLQEIRQRLEKAAEPWGDYDGNAEADVRYLLAALATAEAEGRRQGIEEGKGSVPETPHL